VGGFSVVEGNKTKTAAAKGYAIYHNAAFDDLTEMIEKRAELVITDYFARVKSLISFHECANSRAK